MKLSVRKTILKRVETIRKEIGVTKSVFSKMLGKDGSYYYQYFLNRHRTPGIDLLLQISDEFDVSLDYLVGKSNKR